MNWINVKDRLPENLQCVLVYAQGDRNLTAFFKNNIFYCYDIKSEMLDDIEFVTHWMPLPPPPKEI